MELTERQQEIKMALGKVFEAINRNQGLKEEFSKAPLQFIEEHSNIKMSQEEVTQVINKINTSLEDKELEDHQLEVIAGGGKLWAAVTTFFTTGSVDKAVTVFNS